MWGTLTSPGAAHLPNNLRHLQGQAGLLGLQLIIPPRRRLPHPRWSFTCCANLNVSLINHHSPAAVLGTDQRRTSSELAETKSKGHIFFNGSSLWSMDVQYMQ